MINNDILRRLRYALNIGNAEMAAIFGLAGYDITQSAILDMLKKEEEEGFADCSDKALASFLDGLIASRRGKRDDSGCEPVKQVTRLTNNDILKKIRIAMNFREDDMMEIFTLAEFSISKTELSALFRKKGHKNYKVCGDQLLKNFLKGLTIKCRV